ncbi:TetR/AcrR family transcriptional regulator C-terminal domain-containing protein [Chelativorans sp. AA-79]|uniref:TetR/AcrR family transcriptional regulator C-terminal domain-containing protein n=1 Tax=Chelativorans sp. AA-79 TaxID=3028735 RepID=UPI0023FA0AFF|nr:TetR/AcrR family transcriptional regulator C-terminal domain-containing protein [Chelativorans sp. AA-79]WEX11871.1 TetR/AcrR family transcriptional regulator C-terminal domain-containing protein [Chelativorans sp. AA-79]
MGQELQQSREQEFTPRQHAVLERALELLVAGGERALTTAGVARAANCSKESLYKWFGDRDGLLAAMIAHQASKVRGFSDDGGPMDGERFRAHLVGFAQDLLQVLAGDVSLALNRLAIGQASREGSRLGRLLVEQGRRRIDQAAGALLDAGKRRGHIDFSDRDEAYRTFYGLIVQDLHVRMLLGEEDALKPEDFAARAERAVEQFFVLYGAREKEKAAPRVRAV